MRKVNKGMDYSVYEYALSVWQDLETRWEETFIYSLDDEYLSDEKNSRKMLNEYKRGRYNIVIK